jgi:hypothetical protein
MDPGLQLYVTRLVKVAAASTSLKDSSLRSAAGL